MGTSHHRAQFQFPHVSKIINCCAVIALHSLRGWIQCMEVADHRDQRVAGVVSRLLLRWVGCLYPVLKDILQLGPVLAWELGDKHERGLSLLEVFVVEEAGRFPPEETPVVSSVSRCLLSGLVDFRRRDWAAWYGDPNKNMMELMNVRIWELTDMRGGPYKGSLGADTSVYL